jgi:hypothetical protein
MPRPTVKRRPLRLKAEDYERPDRCTCSGVLRGMCPCEESNSAEEREGVGVYPGTPGAPRP